MFTDTQPFTEGKAATYTAGLCVVYKLCPHGGVVGPGPCLALRGRHVGNLIEVSCDRLARWLEPERPPQVGGNSVDLGDDRDLPTCQCEHELNTVCEG